MSGEICCVCGAPCVCHTRGSPYCNKHYQSMIRYGHPFGKKRVSKNKFIIQGSILSVITSSGDVILADIPDKELLQKYTWCISKTGYAVANIRGKVTKMHRYILGTDVCGGSCVDHINRNPLDNRRANLRLCTCGENTRNRTASPNCKSGHIGIRITPSGKFNVRITYMRKEIHIGNFDTLEEAIQARNQAEDQYHGEFGSHRGGGS